MLNKIKQMLEMPSAWRKAEPKATEKVLHVTLPKDHEFMVSNRFLIDPVNLEKKKPKVSKWVDDINNMPFEFYGKIIDSPDILPSWDITFKCFDGRTETKRIKYKKRDGYSNYRQMQTIYKCILKNWRER